VAPNSLAVARITLSAIGRSCVNLSFEAAIASEDVRSELRIDALEESAEFFDIAFRNQFDPPVIFDNLHFLPGAKTQRLPDGFRYNDLIFGGHGDGLHVKTSIDCIWYYGGRFDEVCQIGRDKRDAFQ